MKVDVVGFHAPAGFLIEAIRPKKGLVYFYGYDTIEEAENEIRNLEKKKPKWRLKIMALYRCGDDGERIACEVCDADEQIELDVRLMHFGSLLPYIKEARDQRGWLVFMDRLVPPRDHDSYGWAAKWIAVEVDGEKFHVPHWLPRVVEQQRQEALQCSAAE